VRDPEAGGECETASDDVLGETLHGSTFRSGGMKVRRSASAAGVSR
jgi:hypothetical protein